MRNMLEDLKSMSEHEQMPDPEKIKEILNVVSEKIPGLLKELSAILYSPVQAKQFAESVAAFYTKLKESGMNDDQAFELTRQYMSALNLGQMVSNFAGREHKHHK